METKTISNKIISELKKAATELEEFQLQAALGNAEARDAYEKAKKKFSQFIDEAKLNLDTIKEAAGKESSKIKAALETLQVHLAIGKADSKEIFEEQSKKIKRALNEIEYLIKKNITADHFTKQ